MANLVDVLQDGGADLETVDFILQALQEAEQSDWGPILEGFVDPTEALKVLAEDPACIGKAFSTLRRIHEEAQQEANKPPPNSDSRFLDVFILGLIGAEAVAQPGRAHEDLPGLLGSVTTHSLARCARLCRRARDLIAIEGVWEPRLGACCHRWGLAVPEVVSGWRDTFFEVLRPRCDAIYVGECRYVHNIRPGASMEARLVKRSYHWVEYRRYVRFLPPDVNGVRRAMVLRDTCPFDLAAEALTTLDPLTHVNASQPEQLGEKSSINNTGQATVPQLQGRIAVGTYTWSGTKVEIEFFTLKETYYIVLELMHGGEGSLAARLEWQEYSQTQGSAPAVVASGQVPERLCFNLGRSQYGGGYAADSEKDHFPPMLARQHRRLEHLLF
mmetsp:Transcript_4763/g.8165  ORF Transcript_4763/g.8165 Transcript_4763/m.8165 type:complete len:386 (-) Transcript_4763:273-1430(-)